MSESEHARLAVKELKKLGVISTSRVLDFHLERVPKAYPAYFGTYKQLPKVRNWLNGFDNLWCVGRNGQHRYNNNNMDHSMMTAIKAVKGITCESRSKLPVWSVNTDKAYHELKKGK